MKKFDILDHVILWIILVILSKLCAIALVVTGIHCEIAFYNKQLPFGLVTNDIGILGIWAYAGWFIAAILITAGIALLFKETIERWIRRELRSMGK